MAHPAVAVLESALRARKLDRTLTTTLPSWEWTDPASLLPMDVPLVDACLRGGLPRGQLSEFSGPGSCGRMTLLLQLMSAATQRGEIVALIDTCDRLDVASAAAAGVDLDRLLWIRGSGSGIRDGIRDSPFDCRSGRPEHRRGTGLGIRDQRSKTGDSGTGDWGPQLTARSRRSTWCCKPAGSVSWRSIWLTCHPWGSGRFPSPRGRACSVSSRGATRRVCC